MHTTPQAARIQTHLALGAVLAGLADDAITGLLCTAATGTQGVGGRTSRLDVDGVPVFCKLIPLTPLEARPENHRSTTNIFQLPTYYQYGIGSVGFGAWRELAAHVLVSDWVVSGAQEQFPLMYHWRILQLPGEPRVDSEADDYLNHAAACGIDESAIQERLRALRAATSHLAIFCEHIPHTLSAWLLAQLHIGPSAAAAAIAFLEDKACEALCFMRSKNFVHFDAHLDNILTDGIRLYFSDFGLALHDSFDLLQDERVFLQRHRHYDAARFASSMVHAICRVIPGHAEWRHKLAKLDLQAPLLAPAAMAALRTHAATATDMGVFARALVHGNRHTPFVPPPVAWC